LKKTILRILAAILVVALFAAMLAGCRSDQEGADFVYLPEFVSLPEGINDVQNLTYSDGKLYFISYVILDPDNWEAAMKIFSMDTDGTNVQELENYVPFSHPNPNASGSTHIMSLSGDADGNLWITESGWFFIDNTPDDFTGDWEEQQRYTEDLGQISMIRKLDGTGAEILSLDLDNALGEGSQVTGFGMDDSGNIFIGTVVQPDWRNEIAVLNSEGILQFKLEASDWVSEIMRIPGDSVAVLAWEQTPEGWSQQVLRKINLQARTWGDIIELPPRTWNIYPGGGDYTVFFQDSSENNLFGINTSTGESDRLINWIESGLVPNSLSNIVAMPDGRIICVNRDYSSMASGGMFGHEVSLDLILFTKTPASELPERIELTLASVGAWALRSAIVDFNRASPTYRIRLIDYSEFQTEDDWSAGITRLTTDIISGNVPDILDLSGLPFYQYVARGVLEDLYPLIDSDPELNRTDFVESVIRAAEVNGGLYRAFTSFSVNTLIGHPSVLGPEMGWNMSEFRAVLDANPQADLIMGHWLTKENFLMATVVLSLDEYIDWATGAVSFDAGGFAQLLEFANRFPAEPPDYDENWDWDANSDENLIRTGRQIMSQAWVSSFDSIQWYLNMYDGDIVFKGFPTESRNGNSLDLGSSLAITTSSENTEGAWEFIRTTLTSNWQRNNPTWGFPVNKTVFNEKIVEAMTENEDLGWDSGFARGMIEMPGMPVQNPPLTQEEIDQILALIDSAVGIVNYDMDLMNIIQEGANDFFTGRSSAQDAARVIQSRITIYVSERR